MSNYNHGGVGSRGFSFWPEKQPSLSFYYQPQNDTDNYSHMETQDGGWESDCLFVRLQAGQTRWSYSTYSDTDNDYWGGTRTLVPVTGDNAYGWDDVGCDTTTNGAILQVQCECCWLRNHSAGGADHARHLRVLGG
jgi:hypothetical protein